MGKPGKSLTLGLVLTGLILVVFASGGAVVYASDKAAPGDVLYPVDTATENAMRYFKSDEDLDEFETEILKERLEEYKKLQGEDVDQERLKNALGELEQQYERAEKRVRELKNNNDFDGLMEEVRKRLGQDDDSEEVGGNQLEYNEATGFPEDQATYVRENKYAEEEGLTGNDNSDNGDSTEGDDESTDSEDVEDENEEQMQI